MENKFFETPTMYIQDVTLQVSDLERSILFYEEVLGLHVLRKENNQVKLSANGQDVILTLEQPTNVISKQRRTTGLYHVAILLPTKEDLGAFLRHFMQLDISNQVKIGASDHIVSEAIYISDPDGNGLEIARDRPSSEWSWNVDNQVTMSTEPLDAHGLLEAAIQHKWNSAPENTIVGHLHLHVDDLSKAKEFYTEGLGFQIVTRYPGALFLSDGGYHHHLAVNIWNGEGAPSPQKNEVGIKYYTLRYPSEDKKQAAIHRLTRLGYKAEDDIVIDSAGNMILLSSEQ
ncbi:MULTISPECIES: VOC family protein [Oceanobacillus]|uniref:Catechol-2,3-dioxygenase n=1 Tax=Oceanobacillus kimchii TaxID=746691 RepID=A0ABQ5TDH9_9BACI|nr:MULTISPECIES: VOC family protein [Oceanobacillus]MBT2652966.1 VOC family protein [Oceanobacillus sp. ISL-73]GLO64773.1 catechol-2,3-dioxygenase [Oceanobacillus kimchii]